MHCHGGVGVGKVELLCLRSIRKDDLHTTSRPAEVDRAIGIGILLRVDLVEYIFVLVIGNIFVPSQEVEHLLLHDLVRSWWSLSPPCPRGSLGSRLCLRLGLGSSCFFTIPRTSLRLFGSRLCSLLSFLLLLCRFLGFSPLLRSLISFNPPRSAFRLRIFLCLFFLLLSFLTLSLNSVLLICPRSQLCPSKILAVVGFGLCGEITFQVLQPLRLEISREICSILLTFFFAT